MAEEGNLGIARATGSDRDELSKEQLQRRMEEARDSISQTVTEIKESVAHQVETVKDALDWREHVKRRPVAFTLGAAGAGFLLGYGIAAAISEEDESEVEFAPPTAHSYAAMPVLGESQAVVGSSREPATNGDGQEGPGLLQRFKETSAYGRLSKEVASLGDRLIDELSTTAHQVVLPAVLSQIKSWIGLDLSEKRQPPVVTGERRTEARSPASTSGLQQIP